MTASGLSPDGSLLLTRAPGQLFQITPLDGGPTVPIRGLQPNERPLRWTADGRSLFIGTQRGFPARVWRLDLETGRRDLWKEFTPGDPAGITFVQPVSISADGNTILFSYSHNLADLYVAEGLK